MRAGGAPLALLLILSTFCTHQVISEDLYWEGEEDSSNEFLEVKDTDTLAGSALRRLKRQFDFFNIFGSSSTTTTQSPDSDFGSVTEDQLSVDEENGLDKDEDRDNDGSGLPERDRDAEPKEKTLRVTFVVIQPYQPEYSNRDSVQFQTFSMSLANAVNQLFDSLPGTQRASLVRIQSQVLDNFSCKVTLDIVTTGYDDTDRITEILRDHITQRRVLGSVAVSSEEFSAAVIDPGYLPLECTADQFKCDSHCVPAAYRCNGFKECYDGTDEDNCPSDEWNSPPLSTTEAVREQEQETLPPPEPTAWSPWETQNRGGNLGETDNQNGIESEFTTPSYDLPEPVCPSDSLRCDQTRCVPMDKRCDSVPDCDDGTDEAGCMEFCAPDDFRCNNGKCIESSRRCNRIVDCPSQEDEQDCECREDEFRCASDGFCIESRKRCDGINNCRDNSDEENCGHHVCKNRGRFRCGDGTCISVLLRCDGFRDCPRDGNDETGCPCSIDQWQCDHGSCIKRSKRCDGRVDCPSDRSDERNCDASGYFRCASGKLIPESRRCNRHYDCPPGDYSDEHNCPCGVGDFKCDNGYCIPESKHCDRTHDCQDGSDERHCTYGVVCMASQYKCSSGQCVQADSYCNGTVECDDGSDESNCPCRDEFKCPDGTCISLALRCDGVKDCRPDGTDEKNCDAAPCPAGSFTCLPGSRTRCGVACDGRQDCDGGEDEQNCDSNNDCNHHCDGICLEDHLICNGSPDCRDGSDELNCDNCDRPNDFRCKSGECLNEAQRCNGVPECSDYSDELNCNQTVPHQYGCAENQFQCRDGSCINIEFLCDKNSDCNDNSDEENCPWFARPTRSPAPAQPCRDSEFTCYDGRCIPHARRCDNFYDCSDFSDEQNCYNSGSLEECDDDSWTCNSGQCILRQLYCDGVPDCDDGSDEVNCPTSRPYWVTTTQYPPYQPPYPPTYSPPYQPTTHQPPYQPSYPPPYQPPTTSPPFYTTTPASVRPGAENQDICDRNEWRCENGPCIDKARRCDGHVDCLYDSSDEFDCPSDSPIALNLKTYPDAQSVRNGGDVVFQCRDEGPQRAPVRWVREGGRPLKPGSSDKHGRLEMNHVSLSDSGVYICQAPRFLGYPGAEIRVELIVEKSPVTQAPLFVACQPYQATCGNGQCIPRSAVCDGKADCTDGSDEDTCNYNGKCEPNQYQCRNRKCVLKTWLCDSEDDCGDGSDEENCGVKDPRQLCLPIEFKCARGDQCIPRSFHCDGQTDCIDGSDEIGCAPVHVIKPPQPSNLRLNPGDTLTLVCEAVGVPTPLISWRLNWGHVPSKCTSTSQDGVGTLTCPNIQPEDSGAYSCEAINNKGTTFATPDSIVYVNRTQICPSGYFNSDARSESECIRCFCFGESSQCRSADLFIYNMPTPLGEGGTRLVGVKMGYNGEATVDSQPITDQYYYQPLRNGATVTKLENYGSNWSYGSNAHPYLTLPETYNNNQLTSYGGHIKYRLAPHSPRFGSDDAVPTIIIMGKYQSLVHYNRGDNSREAYVDVRLTPDSWQKASPRGLVPATREDIMMALDNVDMILLRADVNNAGVNITDFTMESAQHINVGLGSANLVEECTCPPGYEGLSCQKCASGYTRVSSGPWLGNCVREQKPCPPGTYGDPYTGCLPCPCPLTNRENQFARTCSLGASGRVVCDCQQGYAGETCEYCDENYEGNPLIPGGSCEPKKESKCNRFGTLQILPLGECQCKDLVQGRYCDQCKNESFYLSPDFRRGCASCFCTGVTQQCTSSNLRRKTTYVRFNTPQIVDQVKVYSSAALGPDDSVKYNAPVETDIRPALTRNAISLNEVEGYNPVIYYWSLPPSFSGDKVTSYGGYLRYTLRFVPNKSSWNNAADVQLISENRFKFRYFGDFNPTSDGFLNGTVQFLEKGWYRSDGKEISREHFLQALADVKAILVKATYAPNTQPASIESASIETAEPGGDGPQALHVEQCVCPVGYIGTSCEDCAPGYTRSTSGLYLELCGPCSCSGHSNMCHPETGVCYDCRDNTAGENCELCKEGYVRNEYQVCVPSSGIYTTPSSNITCNCDPRGEALPCTSGYCYCKQNVEGEYCDHCRLGTFGLDGSNPLGCLPCYCSGVTSDCHEASHYARIPMAAPIFGDNYGGYSLTDLNNERVISDQFVPAPNESELRYVFSFPPDGELYWSLPVFPGNRVTSYGGKLLLTQSFTSTYGAESNPGVDVVLYGDNNAVYWRNPSRLRSNQELSYQVPLQENEWFLLNSAIPAQRSDFMSVLKNLKRVLVRATLVPDILTTSIADVSMDTATENYDPSAPAAKGVEICMCPEGYSGTSCEMCVQGYYRDQNDRCSKCNCNGHSCQLGRYNEVVCNCQPPYTGPDCSTLGLIMELRPKIHEVVGEPSSQLRNFSLICKYRAPQPLTVTFYHKGHALVSSKSYLESKLHNDGWHGEHIWHSVWNINDEEEIYECHTINDSGFTVGVLSATIPEPGGDSSTTDNNQRPQPPETTVTVRITSPTIKIQEVGTSVNFTCVAQSRITPGRLPVTWTKKDGYLPTGRYQIDGATGTLIITNVQLSDSGTYVCQTQDGYSTGQAVATLRVPDQNLIIPTVRIEPAVNEYFEGDTIELECIATGNPLPRITWQRSSNRPLPRSAEIYESSLVIQSASEEDSGEYRCIASNAAGSTDRTAIVTIRRRPSWPSAPDKLTVSPISSTINEGQSTRLVCTGTTNVPAGSIDWVRQDQTPFLSNVRSVNGVLYIDIARPENQGIYVCQSASSNAPPVPVLVTITPLVPPPKTSNIVVNVDRLKIPTGGSGTVDCNPSGYPLPSVKWSRHQGEFGPGTSQRDNSLIIYNAQDSDAGYYLCEGLVDGVPVNSIYVPVEIERREPPKVEIWPPGEQAVTLGSPFELHCRVVEGVPEPDITWSGPGGRPLGSHAEIQPHNILRFESIEVNDEGEYSCSASNTAGSNTATVILKVRSPPEITITPSDYIEVVQGDSLNIECRASGYPEPTVSIKSSVDQREIVPPGRGIAVLRITSATDRDEGSYLCSAVSPAGTTENPFAIRVNFRGDGGNGGGSNVDTNTEYPNPDQDNNEPSSLIAFEGGDQVLHCDVPEENQVKWNRGDYMQLQPNAVQNGTTLHIYKASKSDSGIYECSVVDPYTGEIHQAATVRLQIVAAPRITLQPKTQTVHPGASPIVRCIVEGDDIEMITWRAVNRRMSSRVEVRNESLIFHQIEVEDAGEYECLAMSRYVNTSAVAEVIVSETDRTPLESHDNEQWAHVGAGVHLSCNVSRPGLRTRWTKDGGPVPRSVRLKQDGSLFIKLALKSDSGRYVCLIEDEYGRQTSNYINLHIEGIVCLDSEFRCYDDYSCIPSEFLCDGYSDCQDNSDEESCPQRDKRLSDPTLDSYYTTLDGEPAPALVSIEQSRNRFRVGETVNVLCKALSRNVNVLWERYGNNQQRQFVETYTYGDGTMLYIRGVEQSDAGLYRCTGRDQSGRSSYADFNLEVVPANLGPSLPLNNQETVYTANLGDTVDLPCKHNLEQPVQIEWRREYTSLPPDLRSDESNLHLERVTEDDAGTYVCRVSNGRANVEAHAILRVNGIVPQFGGNSWLSMSPLKDVYNQFYIEISFKPKEGNGLILYNSQNQGRSGKYVALQLVGGIPQFLLKTGSEPESQPMIVYGDRPLRLNTWHTIRITRINTRVTLDVDNSGPFTEDSQGAFGLLELYEPLYIGGVPDYNQLPSALERTSGFIGCVSLLILGREEKNIMLDSIERYEITDCDTCAPNVCLNNGVCQEARNEDGYMCLCTAGFAGVNCERRGEACLPGLCGTGKCSNTADGYKCACPVTYTGRNCEIKQSIEYPAFTGSTYLAIEAPRTSRVFKMSMKVKATAPVTDGIIMYCAESARGYGGFISLAVRNGRVEFRYSLGEDSPPVVLTADRPLPANEWTNIDIARVGSSVSLRINSGTALQQNLVSPRTEIHLETPMFVGGVDESIILNNNTAVSGGFNGCIKDVMVYGDHVDIVNAAILSANVQECSDSERGDIPEIESFCSQCRNGGFCSSPEATSCLCPPGYTGTYCERALAPQPPRRPPGNPCAAAPCRNEGTCRPDPSSSLNYACDCPLNYAGSNCQMPLRLQNSVGFNGTGYIELPAELLRYDNLRAEPVVIALAFYTTSDGLLLYQKEESAPVNYGDYILLRVDHGRVVLDWDFGGGTSTLSLDNIFVNDGNRHSVVINMYADTVSLSVDDQTRNGVPTGMSNRMNADSSIYIGGIPESWNVNRYPGFTGCIEQVELMDTTRGLNLGEVALSGRNTQRCRDAPSYV